MRRQSNTGRRSPSAARALRAGLCTAAGSGGAVELWRVHPAAPSSAAAPDVAVVLGCAWLAWAVLGYLAVSVAITGALHLGAAAGASAGQLNRLARLTPRRVRRAVDRTVTVGIAAAILGTAVAGPAAAATHHGGTSPSSGRFATAGALDWPGLVAAVRTRARTRRPPRPAAPGSLGPTSTDRTGPTDTCIRRPPHRRPSSDPVRARGTRSSSGPVTVSGPSPPAASAAIRQPRRPPAPGTSSTPPTAGSSEPTRT